MHIFISYASEQFETAKRLELGLQTSGHRVFFDRDALPAGASFDERIRKAVNNSDIFLFLISRDSLRKGAYCLSELAMAEERWPQPDGKILPALFDDTPIDVLPAYLRAVSILVPKGDLVADILDSVEHLASERRRVISRRTAIVAVLLLAVISLPIVWGFRKKSAESAATMPPSTPVQPAGEKNSPEIASDVILTGIVAKHTAQATKFRFSVDIDNEGREQITVIEVGAQTDNPQVRFATSTEWFEVYAGQKRPSSAEGELKYDSNVVPFRWRLCVAYVSSLDLAMAKDVDMEHFTTRYRKEACDPWRTWLPQAQ